MIDLPAIYKDIEALYPDFQVWVKKVEGYMSYPSASDIRIWFKFMKYIEDFDKVE